MFTYFRAEVTGSGVAEYSKIFTRLQVYPIRFFIYHNITYINKMIPMPRCAKLFCKFWLKVLQKFNLLKFLAFKNFIFGQIIEFSKSETRFLHQDVFNPVAFSINLFR